MRRWLLNLLLSLVWGVSGAAIECSKESVLWLQVDQPPYRFIIDDTKHLDAGIFQLQRLDVIRQLPCPWQHSQLTVNYKRAIEIFSSKKPVLMLGLIKTQARKDRGIAYSKFPSAVVFTNQLVVLKAQLDLYQPYMQAGKIDLQALLKSDAQVKIGITSRMSYHGVIDNYLTEFSQSPVWYRRSSSALSGLYSMLKKRRINATFDGAQTMVYWGAQKQFLAELTILPIQGMPVLNEVFVAAPDTPWGRKKLQLIDQMMSDPKAIKRYANNYEKWLPSPELIVIFRSELKQHYQQRYNINLDFE